MRHALTRSSNFAHNVGIKFYTPEEYFLGEAPRPFTRTFDPNEYIKLSADEGALKLDFMINTNPGSTPSSPRTLQEEESLRHCSILWQPSCRKIDILLEESRASRIRKSQPRYSEVGKLHDMHASGKTI